MNTHVSRLLRLSACSAALALATCVAAYAQAVPEGVIMFNPETAQWAAGGTPGAGATQVANIYGDPSKPGPYLYITKSPPGQRPQSQPHTHPDTRTYTVISGTWYIGFGSKFDESKLIALRAGSYYTEPAGVSHFVLVKDDGAVVLISGTGPTRMIPVEDRATSGSK